MTLLVTGGGSGIGRATALRLGRRMPVAVTDIDEVSCKATAAEIVATGGAAAAFALDVRDKRAVCEAADRATLELGPIDCLFANAGVNIRSQIEDIRSEDFDRMFAVHFKGMVYAAQAVLPGMIERKTGAIVNTSSDFAVIGVPDNGMYCAVKTAIYSLTKSQAIEFAPHIRVNAIGPGPIDTPFLRAGRNEEEYRAAVARNEARTPMGRLGRPDEVASVVDYLLSDRAAYITGQLVQPNGGAVMW